MQTTRLGRTDLVVTRTAFGALPIQRLDTATATRLLRRAHEAGITFFDTARGYSDSEEKIGAALAPVRDEIVIATKSFARNRAELLRDLETSLANLRTDRVDILQLHNPKDLPDPDDPESTYAGLVQARTEGKVRFLGITNHRLAEARFAVESGLYDTLQFPLSAISSPEDLALIPLCLEHDLGLVAMKALCGGLLTNVRAAFAFLRQYPNVVPIWGVQRDAELEEFLALEAAPPNLDADLAAAIERDRAELAHSFCRGCGYCLPCPAEIPIPMAARMKFLLRRAPTAGFLTPAWQAHMARIRDCKDCGQCRARCPYGLDTPRLLREMLADYEVVLAGSSAQA